MRRGEDEIIISSSALLHGWMVFPFWRVLLLQSATTGSCFLLIKNGRGNQSERRRRETEEFTSSSGTLPPPPPPSAPHINTECMRRGEEKGRMEEEEEVHFYHKGLASLQQWRRRRRPWHHLGRYTHTHGSPGRRRRAPCVRACAHLCAPVSVREGVGRLSWLHGGEYGISADTVSKGGTKGRAGGGEFTAQYKMR